MIDDKTRWDEIAETIVNEFYSKIEQYAPPEIMEANKKELIEKISDALFSEYSEGVFDGGLEY